jgi:hypothetical protein
MVAFIDIEDNIEYEEREDEFDVDTVFEPKVSNVLIDNEDIDIFTNNPFFIISDTDEEPDHVPFTMLPDLF